MKKTICLLMAALLLAATTACHKIPPAAPSPAYTAPSDSAAASPSETETGMQDGERFDETIMLEGMDETVRYEHIRNETAGFEMDYDYEALARYSGADFERFVSLYEDPDAPVNYLEVRYDTGNAELVADAIRATLSGDHDVSTESYTLDRAGSCVRIDAANAGEMRLQTVYTIPAGSGCLVATAHYTYESAEGFGSRFSYMLDTLEVIDRKAGSPDTADVGALSTEEGGTILLYDYLPGQG